MTLIPSNGNLFPLDAAQISVRFWCGLGRLESALRVIQGSGRDWPRMFMQAFGSTPFWDTPTFLWLGLPETLHSGL